MNGLLLPIQLLFNLLCALYLIVGISTTVGANGNFYFFRIKQIYYCFITDMIRAKKTHCKYISIEGKTHFHIKKKYATQMN